MRLPSETTWRLAASMLPLLLLGGAALTGCTPSIGDSCSVSTDCASDGTRICDTSEPGGFCTVINCSGNNLGAPCPDNAICVLFNANVPGCPFSAQTPSRIGEAQCRNICNSDSDCRTSYVCAHPQSSPWNAETLDPMQAAQICLPALGFIDGGIIPNFSYGLDAMGDAVPPVCQASGPTFDAGFPPIDAGDAGAPDALGDVGSVPSKADAGTADAGGRDAAGAGHDAGLRDGTVDAPHDAAHDGPHEGSVDGKSASDAAADGHPG